MYAGKENIETTRSSSSVLAEIHPKENAMFKSESPMTTDVCSDKAEVSAFAWHTERALQTQRSLSHQLDTLGNVVKPEPKVYKNPAPFNFHPTRDKPGCFKFGPNFPPTSKPMYMKVESENNGHTFGVQTPLSFYQQATYPSRPIPDYYQRHWDTMMMANGQHTDSFRDPQLNQQSWTLPSPWQYRFAYHPQQGYFPYNTINNCFPVGQMRSSVVGTDQARERSQMQEINKRVGSNLDPLQFAVPLSVIQQPRSMGKGDSQTQKWTVVKHEDTSIGSTMEENITPLLKENSIHIKQEYTTTPKEKTTPLLQENIVPTLQQKSHCPPQDETFGCKTCGKEFKVKSLYQSHLQDHNKGFTQVDDMLYRCDTCDREFATTTSILYHLRIHNRLRCPDCNFVCSKKKVMSKHVCRSKKTKKEQGSKKFKSNTQKQTVVKEESNEQENETQHLQKDAIQTEDATPQDTTPTLTHQKSNPPVQELEEKFACKTCGREFKVKSLYDSHVQDHMNGFTQSDTATYKCDTCDREFATPTAVMYHLRIHKMLRCPECNFSCSKKKVLERHVCRFKKAKTGRCQTCTATFPTRSQLNKHYAQNRDHLPIACPWEDCTLRFEHPSDLAKHQVVHTGESRYICEYCGQRFKHANNLKVHIRIHTDEKPFRCDKCDYSGRQQHALDWHNRSHHGIPIPKRSKVDEGNSDNSVPEGSKVNVNSGDLGSLVPEGSKVNVNSDDLGSPVSEGSKVNVNSSDLGSPVSEGSKVNVNSSDLGSPVKVKLDTAAN
ncbi:PREDICTED: zinc finger protein 62 homolog [Branchiostoma belcheri]|uniref:Zinc finger protein 62 homolog n=1 Tax=Branchiostoma belcheri TaxID=7741 RepID=A0A6P4YMZ3_BRABE|nr:PREDICTED: zinc finger protein 62 homolog [Branchiostoma belcheri]